MNARAELEREDAALSHDEGVARASLDRANRARVIIDDPLVKEALDLMERKVMEAWRNSPGGDSSARERLYHYDRAIREFRRFFAEAVTTGKFAEKQLAHIRKRRGFLAFRLRRAS